MLRILVKSPGLLNEMFLKGSNVLKWYIVSAVPQWLKVRKNVNTIVYIVVQYVIII